MHLSNLVTDPLAKNLDGWYWYAEDIRVPTLWDAAAQAGMKVGSVSWPVRRLGRRASRISFPNTGARQRVRMISN